MNSHFVTRSAQVQLVIHNAGFWHELGTVAPCSTNSAAVVSVLIIVG